MERTTFTTGLLVALLLLPGGVMAGGYADNESCADCHAEKYEAYMAGPHGFAANPNTPAAQRGCQSCHGPGEDHVDMGDGSGMLNLAENPETVAAVCQQCHTGGSVAMWQGSQHDARGVGCSSCHSIHGGFPKNLKTERVSDACQQCHKKAKSDFLKTFHHPVNEGRIGCEDCHNPHGTVADKLVSDISIRDKCLSCHAEYRGPHIWEHFPSTESCLTCHTPHGSPHERLLKMRQPFMCTTCHSNSHHPGTLRSLSDQDQPGETVFNNTGDTATDSRFLGRSCLNCHPMIHGSNHPSGKRFVR